MAISLPQLLEYWSGTFSHGRKTWLLHVCLVVSSASSGSSRSVFSYFPLSDWEMDTLSELTFIPSPPADLFYFLPLVSGAHDCNLKLFSIGLDGLVLYLHMWLLGRDVFSFFFSMHSLLNFSLVRVQYRGSIIGLVVCSLHTCNMKLSCTFQAEFFSEPGSKPMDKFIYIFWFPWFSDKTIKMWVQWFWLVSFIWIYICFNYTSTCI